MVAFICGKSWASNVVLMMFYSFKEIKRVKKEWLRRKYERDTYR